ncbi:MAG: hypothetical protein AAGL99_18650, partial [Pseudomonadota bacterium]
MKFSFKTTNHRRPRKQVWFVSRAALVAASMLFAAFAVYYWAFPLYEAGEKELAAFVALLFISSAAVTPAVAPKLVHAKGGAFFGLMIVCVAFGAVDTVGTSGGFLGLDKDMSERAYLTELEKFNAHKLDLVTQRDDQKAEIKKHRDNFGHGKEITRASTLEMLIADPIAERDRIQGLIDTLVEPSRASRFNVELVSIIALLIQI